MRGKRLTDEERDLLDSPEFRAMSGINDEDGGILIPEDIGRQIHEFKRQFEPLEQYVTVEPVTTRSGTRLLEKNADMVPFSPVEELGIYLRLISLNSQKYPTQSWIMVAS